jgi:multidrug resistance efflux pump
MCAPLLNQDEVLGVVEVVNRQDGSRFDEDALFFLQNISEQAAIALNNANLLVAERKVRELDALLAISKEITSTLNLDHVLSTVVNQASTVLPFDQCAVGIFDRGRFVLGAVSGEKEVPRTPEMGELRRLLEGVAEQPEAVSADHYEEGWEVKPEGDHRGLVGYLEAHEYNGFYALPLRDEQGTLGVLALLSGDAEFLSENHLEVVSILASQTTIAIRNARLYQDVPLLRVWEPLLQTKQRWSAVPYARRVAMATRVGLAALLLVALPWKMRIETNATVVPAERRLVSAPVGGVIRRVLVHEADQVVSGQLLAEIDDSDFRTKLAAAQANLALARRNLVDAEFRRDLGGASQARLRMQMYQAEVSLYQEKIAKAGLRAPIAGVVVTPKVEEKVGKLLAPGDPFCELMAQDRMAAEMNVPETDVALVGPGDAVALKLNAFSTFTYHGTVERVAAQTISAEGEQFFVGRAVFPNSPGHRARDGMVGRAKISAHGGWFESGWYPVGYVMLRAPGHWAWQKIWSWLP